LFQRADEGFWQFIAGGGEGNETPLQAARCEIWKEAHIPANRALLPLQSMCSVPITNFSITAPPLHSGGTRYVIAEYTFGVDAADSEIVISSEHRDMAWLSYNRTRHFLRFDSNRTALGELNQRLQSESALD
jgi:dATP pyrophosphohydrolase